jgi:hypothetical protein
MNKLACILIVLTFALVHSTKDHVLRLPEECKGEECIYTLRWNRNRTHTRFHFHTLIDESLRRKELWTAFAFSNDTIMVIG